MTTISARAWPTHDASGRTHQKVRRGSREALDHEPVAKLSAAQRRQRSDAFRKHATAIRPKGKRRGCEGSYGLYCGDVLDYLMGLAVRTGRVFPSYGQIAEHVGCAYKTAVRCIRQLEHGGWLGWERRFVRTERDGLAEPQVHQTSNFYVLKLPNVARKLIEAWVARRPPISADLGGEHVSAETEADLAQALALATRDAERRNHHTLLALSATRTPEEAAAVLLRAKRLGDALDKLGAGAAPTAVDDLPQREFPKHSQSRANRF